MAFTECCLKGFRWEGTPIGKVVSFPTSSNQAYVTGSNEDVAVMLIHDALGWEFNNIRLLADHYAQEANATVYVPDFYGGESMPSDRVLQGSLKQGFEAWKEIGFFEFTERHSRKVREPEILECAKHLRSKYKKVGAVGYCFGGWAVFWLGAKGRDLLDCIVAGHPTWLTKEDIDRVDIPVQILAPELDPAFSAELKEHSFKKLQENGVIFDYQHFPGVEHACFTRGDTLSPKDKAAMARGKNAAVSWLNQFLHDGQ